MLLNELPMRMLVITKGLHLNVFFSLKSSYAECDIHSDALYLFAMQDCLLLANSSQVSRAVGTNLSATPSTVGWLTKSCHDVETGCIHWAVHTQILSVVFDWFSSMNLPHLSSANQISVRCSALFESAMRPAVHIEVGGHVVRQVFENQKYFPIKSEKSSNFTVQCTAC